SMRQAVISLLQSVDLRVEAFGSAVDFLKKRHAANGIAAACLILDVRLPGVSGLDFQAELAKADSAKVICSSLRQIFPTCGSAQKGVSVSLLSIAGPYSALD